MHEQGFRDHNAKFEIESFLGVMHIYNTREGILTASRKPVLERVAMAVLMGRKFCVLMKPAYAYMKIILLDASLPGTL